MSPEPHRPATLAGAQPEKVAGEGSGVSDAPTAVFAVCPECQQGRCRNCDGSAWNDAADDVERCHCDHEPENPKTETGDLNGYMLRQPAATLSDPMTPLVWAVPQRVEARR